MPNPDGSLTQEELIELLQGTQSESDPADGPVSQDERIDDKFGTGDNAVDTDINWFDNIRQQLLRDIKAGAKDYGYSTESMENWFEQQTSDLADYLIGKAQYISRGIGTSVEWPQTTQDFQQLEDWGKQWLAGRDRTGLAAASFGLFGDGGGGGGGGRVSVSRGPTADEIRASFDMDQLSREVTKNYRGLLFDEPKDPRAVAKAYVDTVVANPDQKLDFNTFVRTRIQQEPRYNFLYKNKPRGMTEEQFFQPYVNTASQMLAPREIEDAALGAAQLGASQQQFRERIGRTNSVTTSAPFLAEFEGRMQDLAGVFKG